MRPLGITPTVPGPRGERTSERHGDSGANMAEATAYDLPWVLAPSFPSEPPSDGQSIYVVEATRALAELFGRPLNVISLRLEGQSSEDWLPFAHVQRVEPAAPVSDPFRLYEPAFFDAVMRGFAPAVARRLPPRAAVWAHGYELGPAARALRRGGHPVVTVLHYALAQESAHYLAAADDPLRRPFMVTRLLPAVGAAAGRLLREPLVRTSSRLAAPGARLPWPAVVRHQLRKLAMERAAIAASHQVVAVGRSFAGSLARFYPWAADRIVHCHAGAPPAATRRAGPSDRLRLLTVGRPTPQKGWDYLAEALHWIEAHEPAVAERIEMAVVGGLGTWAGPHSAFGSNVRDRFEALRRVRFSDLGRRARADVRALYRQADAFVFPSDYEPFGLVLLEAMACGVPVVASDADGPRDVVRPGCGWLVPFSEPRQRHVALGRALLRLAALPADELAQAGQRARHRAAEFRWADCARAHAAFVTEARRQASAKGPLATG